MTDVSGKSVIVTGGGQGIGLALARHFAARGARVVVAEYNPETVHFAKSELDDVGSDAIVLAADVRERNQVDMVVDRTMAAFGRIDAVINNAQNSFADVPFEDHSEEQLRRAVETGAFGSIRMMQAVFPHMKAAGGGSIVNVASSTALQGFPGGLGYVVSKGAIMALTRAAAREWGPYNIRVNAYAPSAMTPASKKFAERQPEQYRAIMAQIPFGRLGDASEDIAPAVAFLVSDASHFITGQIFAVDGGQYIGPI